MSGLNRFRQWVVFELGISLVEVATGSKIGWWVGNGGEERERVSVFLVGKMKWDRIGCR